MGRPQVIIRISNLDDEGTYRSELELIVDGEIVGTGTYGGEPEDNIESRDYAWVKTALKNLGERLGATVTIERTPLVLRARLGAKAGDA